MCSTACSTLVFVFATLTIPMLIGTKMATEGLPLRGGWDRGPDSDILAGPDFLSVLMGASRTPSYVRSSRSTPNFSPETTENQLSTFSDKELKTSDSSSSDGVIVAVRVSSSVGKTLINKPFQNLDVEEVETTTATEQTTEATTMEYEAQNLVASEDHPSIIAEANKSEFSVEESEPITRNSDLASDFSRGYPASVHALPGPQHLQFNSNGDFLQSKTKLQPYHQTVIYHNNPREPGRARSVSYSTVIQSVPHPQTSKKWNQESDQDQNHERHERHYNGNQGFQNSFADKVKNVTKLYPPSMAESRQFVVTSSSVESKWDKPEESKTITTERNWEQPEKVYPPPTHQELPKVYGRPEQNYEVDEAVSVVTNGRAHGVQSQKVEKPEEAKKDDNQKVGYVVEGRNYRKYRVEERTADGFIVGEYGVVSHDDGSLRGVRYTADGTINPRLIYDALMKFLSL